MSSSSKYYPWFHYLESIQQRMATIAGDTNSDLKVFSNQKLKDLIKNDTQKENLKQFCDENQIGLVENSDLEKKLSGSFWIQFEGIPFTEGFFTHICQSPRSLNLK